MKDKNSRVNGIDGLRAIAMTMVIAQHSGLLPFGWIGVWLFFVISGYVITHGFIVEEGTSAHIPKLQRYNAFIKRRVIRIFPAYFGYILMTLFANFLFLGWAYEGSILGLLTFTFNWQMIYFGEPSLEGFGHLWTLSVEQQFYLIFPLLFLWLANSVRWSAMLFLVILGPLFRWLWDMYLVQPFTHGEIGSSAYAIYASTFCHLDAFLLGALLAKHEQFLMSVNKINFKLTILVLLISLCYIVYYLTVNSTMGASGINLFKNIISGYLYGNHRHLWLYSIINMTAVVIILMVISGARGTLWLSNPVLSWVGKVSYGGYLIHALILWFASFIFNEHINQLPLLYRVLGFLTVWLVTVIVASISFKYYELPVSKRLRKWATPYRN